MTEFPDLTVDITDGGDGGFRDLILLLDEELYTIYGEAQKSFAPLNIVDGIRPAVVVRLCGVPVACGAYRAHGPDTVEVKRIFVRPEHRGKGLARLVMKTLEDLARVGGYAFAILETGKLQPAAVSLYVKCGYGVTDNFGPYVGNPNSVCMRKAL